MPIERRDRLPSILGLVALATLAVALIIRPHPLPPGSADFPTIQQEAPSPRLAAPGVPVVGRSYAVDTIGSGDTSGTPAAPLSVRAGADVHVAGWVVDPRTLDPVIALIVRVDGVELAEVDCKGSRPDVAAVLGTSGAASSGFDAVVSTHGLRAGNHVISFVAVASDHRRITLPTRATIVISAP